MIVEHTSETPFLFQLGPEGAELTGYAGSEDPVVFVPEQFEGHPVTGIGERAFYQHKEIQRIHLPDTIVHIGGYAFAECRFLEQMDLPDKVASIGDYAFYNCIRLKRVLFPPGLDQMGYGSFKNDTELTDIHLYTEEGGENSINTILDDTNHETTVTFHYPDGTAGRLIFTEFYLDEVPNIEARQFNHLTYGSGSMYRNCLGAAGMDYRKYDSLFSFAVHMDEPATVCQMAVDRLMYPKNLSAESRDQYLDYLISRPDVLTYLMDTEQRDALNLLMKERVFDKEVLDAALDYGQRRGKNEYVSLLIHYKNRWYPAVEKEYDL